MLKADFKDAEAKLQRANEHISDLEEAISGFLHTDFYRVTLEADQATGRMKLVFQSLHEPGQDLNLILGDAISNLRSSLDYAINAAIFPVTGTHADGGFPFKDHPNDLKATITKGPISQLGNAFTDLLVDQIQAQKGGASETLWVLNKLRNIDKHRMLVATVELAAVIVSFRSQGLTMNNCMFGTTAGQRSVILSAPVAGFELTSKPSPVFEVRVNEPPYIEEVNVLSFLRKASGQVASTLKAFKVLLD
jgi:hypothetical protein